MNTIKPYLLIGLALAIAALAGSLLLDALVPQSANLPDATSDARSEDFAATASESCTAAGGNWLFEFGECEYADADWCSDEGGVFDECASACRHSDDPLAPCTMQCVPTCGFNPEPGGEAAGPELDADTAAKLVIGRVGHCVIRGDCDKMDISAERGVGGVWRVEIVERGLRDDSIRDRRTVFEALDAETGWELGDRLSEEYACQEGRGSQEFSPDPCL